jgi:hypothetical protein
MWWSKPPDVDACPHTVFICSSVLSHKLTNLLPLGFEVQTKKLSRWFCGPNHQTADVSFDAQIEKSKRVILRPKHKNCNHRFWDQIRRNRRPWFWGWTKKPTLLTSLCMMHIAHSVTRPLDRPTTENPTCVWSSPIICTKSPTHVSILVAVHHVAPVWQNHLRNEGFVSQDHIGGFSTKRECANTHT